jgi:hypothetical protein
VKMINGGIAELSLVAELDGVKCKIRADYIIPDKGIIFDVKTSRQETSPEIFKESVSMFGYDLSAALYARVAEAVYGRPFDFYFGVISKSDLNCEVYLASDKTIALGNQMVSQALRTYKRCLATGIWEPITEV